MSKFLNPNVLMAQAGIGQGETVADLGCGSGFYVLPAAQLVGASGLVYGVDVMEDKLAATVSIANQFGQKNVHVVQADLSKPLLEIPEHSCDVVVAGNILHEISEPDMLVKNIYRLLKVPGKLLVVEWKTMPMPFGPPMEKRIDQQKVEMLFLKAGLRKVKELEADAYHYAVIFEK